MTEHHYQSRLNDFVWMDRVASPVPVGHAGCVHLSAAVSDTAGGGGASVCQRRCLKLWGPGVGTCWATCHSMFHFWETAKLLMTAFGVLVCPHPIPVTSGSHRGLICVALTMTSVFSQADGRPHVPSGQRSAPALRGGGWTGSRCGPHRGHTVTDPQGHLEAWLRISKVGVDRPPGTPSATSSAGPQVPWPCCGGDRGSRGTRQQSFLTGWVAAPGGGLTGWIRSHLSGFPFTSLPGKAPPPPLLTTTNTN